MSQLENLLLEHRQPKLICSKCEQCNGSGMCFENLKDGIYLVDERIVPELKQKLSAYSFAIALIEGYLPTASQTCQQWIEIKKRQSTKEGGYEDVTIRLGEGR